LIHRAPGAAEARKRERYRNGERSYDLDGLRQIVEGRPALGS
jgi:hypothetical protein